MSGRARHMREGVLITNRKTDRRQSPKRPLLDRLSDLNARCSRRYPNGWRCRIGFLLPKRLQPFVSTGPHGVGVTVLSGFVQIANGSAEECFQSAIEFFAAVAKGHPAFHVMATIMSLEVPDRHYGRWLCVVNGAMVVCSGNVDPLIYEPRAS